MTHPADAIGHWAQLQASSEIAARLREITRFESVHVISMSQIGFEGSTEIQRKFGHQPFSERLGALAAGHLAYELAFSLLMWTYEHSIKENRPFRIGVAAGSTVRAIVENFRFPEQFVDKLSINGVSIEVCPLAIGPIPETASSAGFIASSFANRLRQSLEHGENKVEFVELSQKIPNESGYHLKMKAEIQKARNEDPFQKRKTESDKKKLRSFFESSKMRFDWILTGVGSVNSGQLNEHLELRFTPEDRQKIVTEAAGDICSRIYTHSGEEMFKDDADKFVGISFAWMQYLSNVTADSGHRSHRICAVTGGEEKYPAIMALVKNSTKELRGTDRENCLCLYNSLVTDELTARRLVIDLHRLQGRNRRLAERLDSPEVT